MTQFARSVPCETSRSFGDFVAPLFVIYWYSRIPLDYGRLANTKWDISSVQYPEKHVMISAIPSSWEQTLVAVLHIYSTTGARCLTSDCCAPNMRLTPPCTTNHTRSIRLGWLQDCLHGVGNSTLTGWAL